MKRSVTKGKKFERLVANLLRAADPAAVVRRSEQADKPYEPDVVVSPPSRLARFWFECQHADQTRVAAKLLQAERDVAAHANLSSRLPVVVWRQTRSPTISVSMRLWVLATVYDGLAARRAIRIGDGGIVTMSLAEFLPMAVAR